MNIESRISSLIENPPRESFFESAIILLAASAMSIGLAAPGVPVMYTIAGLALLLVAAVTMRTTAAFHIAMFGFLLFLLPLFGTFFKTWPLSLLAPILIYVLIVSIVPGLRKSINWLKKGRMDLAVLRLVAATIVISASALITWVMMIRPDIEHHLALMPKLPLWVYPFAGVGFAMLNAAMEEAVFRGVIMDALDSAVGANNCSVGLQAIPFAALHYLVGFPNGFWGFIMTLAYGIMLGIIRRSSKGLLAPFVAHIAADLTIFSILAFFFLNV